MPRTIAAECPGCPPLRSLTTDALGLIKVVEVSGKGGTPKVVETWGTPDASQSVIASSYLDRRHNPLMAVARKNGLLEFVNPLNGDALATTKVNESSTSSCPVEDDPIVGLHLLGTTSPESTKFLTCTTKGKVCLKSITMGDGLSKSLHDDSITTWDACNSGKVSCSAVSGDGSYAIFGGNRVEVNVWDLDKCTKMWTAKSPPSNSLNIFSPTWFTAATFLSKDDHHKIAAGTNNHQYYILVFWVVIIATLKWRGKLHPFSRTAVAYVRLYDISAQRRPVISVSFRESPIKAVTADPDGYTVYIGTGYGDIASFDMRTGKLLGCFLGKCSGSVRSIARHPELPLIASCGLDRYVRFWDTKTRQLLSAVFLKQHLTNVMIDSHFSAEVTCDRPSNLPDHTKVIENDEESPLFEGRRTAPKRKDSSKSKKSKKEVQEAHSSDSEEDDDEQPARRRRKQSKEGSSRKKAAEKTDKL